MRKCVFVRLAALTVLTALTAVVAVAGPATAVAAPPPPAQPRPQLLDARDRDNLLKLVAKLNSYRWGEPVVEDFAEPGDAAKRWVNQLGASIRFAHGRMLLSSQQAKADANANPNANPNANNVRIRMLSGAQWGVYRTLPAEMAGSPGLRVDAWVELAELGSQFGMFLHADKPSAQPRWDYIYYFASGNDGSNQQLMRWDRRGSGYGNGNMVGKLQPDKLVHVVIEVIGGRLSLSRNDSEPFVYDDSGRIVIAKDSVVGFTARQEGMRVRRLTYRRLVSAVAKDEADRLIADSPLATRAKINELLGAQVVRRLDDPSYAVRQEATALLVKLLPLSAEAVAEAVKSASNPEMKSRLEAISQSVKEFKVEPLAADAITPPAELPLPPEAIKQEQRKPATTQDDQPRPAPNKVVPRQLRLRVDGPAVMPAEVQVQPPPRPADR